MKPLLALALAASSIIAHAGTISNPFAALVVANSTYKQGRATTNGGLQPSVTAALQTYASWGQIGRTQDTDDGNLNVDAVLQVTWT